MEQNLANEIVALLLSADCHPRGIADLLQKNHMTVIRTLERLSNDNVVDFRIEGKNKIYSLKKTVEARNAIFVTEYYKLSRLVDRYPILRPIVQSVLSDPALPLAVFFGSHVKGTATKQSDIDLYIETEDRNVREDLEQRFPRLSVKIGDFDPDTPLVREIVKDHVIVKGVERYYEKTGFFG